jgi:hypothetical protein
MDKWLLPLAIVVAAVVISLANHCSYRPTQIFYETQTTTEGYEDIPYGGRIHHLPVKATTTTRRVVHWSVTCFAPHR